MCVEEKEKQLVDSFGNINKTFGGIRMSKKGKNIHEGYCKICNKYGKLTFEHIPPKCALNDKEARIYTGDSFVELMCNKNKYPWETEGIKYKLLQKGLGDYTLCSNCNNITGELYGEEYKKWFYTVLKLINDNKEQHMIAKTVTIRLMNVYPGRFIRQILSIICSTYHGFSSKFPYIKDLILNKDYIYNDKLGFRIYMYLLKNPYNGYTGMTGILLSDGRIKMINEIDLYPFGFYLSLSDTRENETEITNFINCNYDDCCEVEFTLNLHEKNNLIPTDFRTKEEIMEAKKQ